MVNMPLFYLNIFQAMIIIHSPLMSFFKLLLILFHCLEHLSLALVLLDLIGYCIECFKVYFMFIAAVILFIPVLWNICSF